MSAHGLKLTIVMNAFTLNYDLRQLEHNMKACVIGALLVGGGEGGLAFIFHSVLKMTAPQPAPQTERAQGGANRSERRS